MSESNKKAYADYRIEKAEETYEAALILFNNAQWNSAINRLYYSCFYAVSALLTISNIETKSHSGAKTQFFLHFIKTDKISPVYGKLYADLFDWRQKGDYGDFFDFDKQSVKHLLLPTTELVQIVKEIIKELN